MTPAVQARQLQNLAGLLREHPSERMLDHIADILEALGSESLEATPSATRPATPAIAVAIATSAAVRPRHGLSMTPNAIRKRAEYRRNKAQLELPAIAAAKVAIAEPLSLSDLKISKKRERGAATSRDVVQPDATLPDDCRQAFADAIAAARCLLCVDFVWKKFTSHAHRKRWRVADVPDRWASWFDREIKYTHERAVTQRARDRPGLAMATAPLIAERTQWAREAQASRSEVLAAAARAMAVFS